MTASQLTERATQDSSDEARPIVIPESRHAKPWRRMLVQTLAAFSLACAHPPETKEPPMNPSTEARTLLATGRVCESLSASYFEANGLEGSTFVRLDSGHVQVEQRPTHGDANLWQGSATEAECQEVLRFALDGRLWEALSKDEAGVPDEPRPRLQVTLSGKPLAIVEGWRHELIRNAGFRDTRDALLGIASRVTEGKVTY
jgi:hypothetical protein